jgi:biotin carboxyl carrier protein
MELRAPRSDIVRDLSAVAGREVAQGEVLAVITST